MGLEYSTYKHVGDKYRINKQMLINKSTSLKSWPSHTGVKFSLGFSSHSNPKRKSWFPFSCRHGVCSCGRDPGCSKDHQEQTVGAHFCFPGSRRGDPIDKWFYRLLYSSIKLTFISSPGCSGYCTSTHYGNGQRRSESRGGCQKDLDGGL